MTGTEGMSAEDGHRPAVARMTQHTAEQARPPSFAEQVCGHVHPSVLAEQIFGACDECKRYVLAVLESDWLRERDEGAAFNVLDRVEIELSKVGFVRGMRSSPQGPFRAVDRVHDAIAERRTPPGSVES